MMVLLAVMILLSGAWIDLTHPFDKSTIYWPTEGGFEIKKEFKGKTKDGFWYEANSFCAPEHGGTHLDAPVHFAKGKWTADVIPLDRLTGEAAVIDLSKKVGGNADYLISKKDILEWESKNGSLSDRVIVLFRTGWERFWPNRKKYMGTDKPGDVTGLHFPGIAPEAAQLLAQRKVKAVGLDTASLDYGQSKNFKTHQILLGANIPGFENLANLKKLPAKGAFIVALPMKIKGGSGGPLRIVAHIINK